jgi:hypothetical protein
VHIPHQPQFLGAVEAADGKLKFVDLALQPPGANELNEDQDQNEQRGGAMGKDKIAPIVVGKAAKGFKQFPKIHGGPLRDASFRPMVSCASRILLSRGLLAKFVARLSPRERRSRE